ncbi:MAG: CHAT domain-containing protein [Lewinellaceae bacterium]|nr:CHAT domain-containing protein [Lewinellaceae bacterium]
MNSEKPVVFLAFANEYDAERRLDNIVKERELLESILNEAYRNGLCDKPVVRQNVSIKTFLDILGSDEYKNRIAIIHYGGHADGYQLLLEGMDGKRQIAKGDGLVNIMAKRENQENLKLIFLNGCSTERLAKALTDRGVPIVIGTSTSIDDDEALTLASRFYTGLANGLTMGGAWADAKNEVESVRGGGEEVKGSGKTRGFDMDDDIVDSFPWEESFRDSAAEVDFKNWNLPEISKNPLFNLPPLEKTQLPASPFLFLKPYEARHAEIFFGRSSYIRDLWLKVVEPSAPPIILLYGETGAGKSSLLDAGLRPRLEAAKEEGEKRFEVLYRRRDQDLGLVRTLADMLSYQPDEAPEAPEPSEEPGEDPNLEKLQQIESIARELEEETANTFRSIINRYKSLRAYKPGKGAGQGLYAREPGGSLKLNEKAGEQLRKAWLKKEKETGRELIVILDQVEEAITQPNSNLQMELENLLKVLKDMFVRPAAEEGDKIKGKIILGYREEFNAKILARSQDYELSPSTVFLEQLRKIDIEEIFRELPKLRGINYYNLTVEEGLPSRIANDLLKGRSAVAPVLQLLLTRLWENTYDPKTNSAHFTIDAYNKTQSDGKEMEKYFQDQMEEVRKWNPEVVESGLVLDILQFHVTELGTSRRRDFEKEIRPRYEHLETEYGYRKGFVEELVKKLKSPDIFLLNDEGRGYTSLPHDTLAPIVRREYDRSDKLGQRSARILEIKKSDLTRIREEEEELKKLRLNDNDLEVVWEGKKGMRNLNEKERLLLQVSLEEREKRLRQRRAMIKGGTVLMLFILVLSVFAGSLSVTMAEQIKNGAITRANEASVLEQDKNPIKAIELAQFAYSESKTHPLDVVSNLYGLYQKHSALDPYGFYSEEDLFYDEGAYYDEEPYNDGIENGEANSGELPPTEPYDPAAENYAPTASPNLPEPEAGELPLSFSLTPTAKIRSLNYYPSFGILASLNDTTLKFWPQENPKKEETINLRKVFTDLGISDIDISYLEFGQSADGKKIQALYREHRDPLYLMAGNLITAPYLPVIIRDTVFYEGQAGDSEYSIGYYDFYLGKFVDEFGLNYSREEFNQYLEEYYFGYIDPYQDLYVHATGGPNELINLNADALFSFNLMDRERSLFRKKEWEKLKRQDWQVLDPPVLENDEAIPLRTTNLKRGVNNGCLTWRPDNFTPEPSSVFFEPNELYYLTDVADGLFLAVSPHEGITIRNLSNEPVAQLLPMDSVVVDIAISPDHQHILAMTEPDGIFLWGMTGNLIGQYQHPNVGQYAFSADGARLLTLSDTEVKVFSLRTQKGPASFSRPADAHPMASFTFARFHKDNKSVIIGLSSSGELSSWQKFKSIFSNRWNSQAILWEPDSQEEVVFNGPKGLLLDASISEDGKFAVAVQPGSAVVIPNPKEKIRKNEYHSKPIQVTATGKGNARKTSEIFLSPCGRYIVLQSLHDSQARLYNHKGQLVNAYNFQNRYRQGFNGQLFTPDDKYLMGARPKEVFFWQPEDEPVETWASDFELYPEDKLNYGLDTFMDYIPGTKSDARWWADAKWWAIAVILTSFIFILLYFSDFIIRFVQQKNYVELAVYFAVFSLFSLLLFSMWKISASGLDPELNKVAFYCIVFATLAIVIAGARKSYSNKKYPVLLSLGLVGLFVLFGFFKFIRCEKERHVEEQDREYKKAIQWSYQENKELFQKLHLDSRGLEASPQSVVDKLKPEELKKIVEEHPDQIPVLKPSRANEWTSILSGLILLLAFLGVVGYPAYRSLSRYRKEKATDWKFYRPLLLPAAFLSVAFWAGAGLLDNSEYFLTTVLNIISGVLILGAMVRQSRIYLRAKKYASFVTFGWTAFSAGIVLLDESGIFALALAAAFILGRQCYRQSAFGRAFLFFSGGILLATGAIIWSIAFDQMSVLLGLPLAAGLVLGFYGFRRQLQIISSKRAAGKRPLINWAAILGIWMLISFSVMAFLGSLLEDYGYEDAYEAAYYGDEGDWQSPEVLQEEVLPENQEAEPDDVSTEEMPLSEPEEAGQEAAPEVSPDTASSTPPETGFDSPVLNNRQQLIIRLFDADEITRERAREGLATYWTNDRALIPELVQYCYDNPDNYAGITETIDMLALQSDQRLISNTSQLEAYFKWVAQMELGADIEEKIQELKARMGN